MYAIKSGDAFFVVGPLGDIDSELSPEQGFFLDDVRFLNRWKLSFGGKPPYLLSCSITQDNILFGSDLTNPGLKSRAGQLIRGGYVHVFRSKFVWRNTVYERYRFRNYLNASIAFPVELEFGADYADIFELRGAPRRTYGRISGIESSPEGFTFHYEGADGLRRVTRVFFSHVPEKIEETRAYFTFLLRPRQEFYFYVTVTAAYGEDISIPRHYEDAYKEAVTHYENLQSRMVYIETDNELFNSWFNRSRADLCTALTETQEGLYPYAGVPWFNTIFGRDGLVTALQILWAAPDVARGVLVTLSRLQALRTERDRDAEPGKLPHELRKGEMARVGDVPFALYYGSVDVTPLFLMLTGEYFRRTGDEETLLHLWGPVKQAVRWMVEYGDIDGDGFIEYRPLSDRGLRNQGWKDSDDAVFHADGSFPEVPIALVEVQAYAYRALTEVAQLARRMNDAALAREAYERARVLLERFHRAFWSENTGMFTLALDAKKCPCEVRTSNAGHVLFAGAASGVQADQVGKMLMDKPFFSGWGVRTVAETEVLYNPMSYHNGSVWPHDNSIIAAGLARYGMKEYAARIFRGLFDAAVFLQLHSLPELFCGFRRRPGQGPTLYPGACRPQAWAAGSVFLLMSSLLGLVFDPQENLIAFDSPYLPDFLSVVEVYNLRLGDKCVDLVLRRYDADVVVQVRRKEGRVNVVVKK